MSSVQSENSCQSSAGAPNSAQMTGVGKRRAMSETTSQRPTVVTGSTRPVMISMINGAQPLGAAWCEGLRNQPAQSMMHSAVEAQNVGGCPVPQPPRGHAPRGESHALGRDEPVVAQNRADQVVAQYLGSVGADGDRGLPRASAMTRCASSGSVRWS